MTTSAFQAWSHQVVAGARKEWNEQDECGNQILAVVHADREKAAGFPLL
jgi:hypothetical protein